MPALLFFSDNFRTEYMPPKQNSFSLFLQYRNKTTVQGKDKSFHIIWLFLFIVYFNHKIYLESISGSSLLVHRMRYVLAIQNQGKDWCHLICHLLYYVGGRV